MRPALQRFTSRKFLMAVAAALLIVLNEGLEMGIPTDAYGWLVGVVISYIVGESFIDASVAKK